MKNNSDIGVGYFPHGGTQDEHDHDGYVVIGNPGTGKALQAGNTQFTPGYIRDGENNTHQNNRKRQGGQGQVGAPQPKTGNTDNQTGQDRKQRSQRDTTPRWNMSILIQHGGCIRSNTEKKSVPKVHLAGKAGQKVPAGCQNGKDAGQNQDA